MAETYLVISDLQIPFEAHGALKFVAYLKRHYKIKDEHCLCVGDETDQFHGGMYPKGADFAHTPNSELKVAREKLQEWYALFPEMKVAVSNHGIRWLKKASAAELPSQLLRKYEEIIDAPPGWVWKDQWEIAGSRHPFTMVHGMQFGGMYAYRQAPVQMGGSVVFGHLHSSAGIAHVKSDGLSAWGFNTGCLIDTEAYAFKYGKYNKWKPNLGVGIIADGGRVPIWIPFE